MPVQRTLLISALVAAVCLGVGIGIGAAIWEGSGSSQSMPAAAEAAATTWLFVASADSGLVTATGGDALTILLRDTAPRAVAFTDRPGRQAEAIKTPDLWAELYANGSAPPNAALSFDHAGQSVVVPIEMLNVTGRAQLHCRCTRAERRRPLVPRIGHGGQRYRRRARGW